MAQSAKPSGGVLLPKRGQYLNAAVEMDFVLPPGSHLPYRVDMSPYFPVAGDQGAQSSCTAWAMGYGLATFRDNWERNTRPDKSKKPDPNHVYSPGFLFNLVKQTTQSDSSLDACLYGVDMGATFTVACQVGNCSWAEYPYDTASHACHYPVDSFNIDRARAKTLPTPVALWHTNTGVGPTQLPFCPEQWKFHLARKEPIVVAFSIDCDFYDLGYAAGDEGRPFLWDVAAVSDTGECSGGHAMVCTGYNDRDSTFTFLNSFGVGWGDSGYVQLSYRTLRAACREAYVFSQQWWSVIPVHPGRPMEDSTVTDSAYTGSIKRKQLLRFHNLEVRMVTVAPDGSNMVVQFRDSSGTVPPRSFEFPAGVDRCFLFDDKLWYFRYEMPPASARAFTNAYPFRIAVDPEADEELEEAIDDHYERWRSQRWRALEPEY